MRYKEENIVAFFNLRPGGQKGWFIGNCPYCLTRDKFGIRFNSLYKGRRVSSFNCFAGKCKVHGSVFQLLKDFNKLDLAELQFINIFKDLEEKHILFDETESIDYSMKEYPKPIGYVRIFSHPYLDSRGFTVDHYKHYNIGIAPLDPKIGKNYVIFSCEDNDKYVGWLKRSIYSKEQIKKYEKLGKPILRWGNSKNVDFEKYLFGINECIKNVTHTVILVEGITSKANVDRLLNLFNNSNIKCCATFGKKISLFQIKRLLDKSIKSVILLYDPDAVEESKRYSEQLTLYFKVLVGYIKNLDKDPGDLNLEELENVLNNLESPLNFRINKLQKKKLSSYGT